MEIHDTFLVRAPVEEVWQILQDPQAVAECFPGATLTAREEDGSLRGAIRMNLGPTVATFSGMARVTTDAQALTATIETAGADRRGSTRVQGEFTVRAQPRGVDTELQLGGLARVSGPLAGFAENGGVHVLKVLVADFAVEIAARATSVPATPSGAADPATAPAAEVSGAGNEPASSSDMGRRGPRSMSVWSMLTRAVASAWRERRARRRRA